MNPIRLSEYLGAEVTRRGDRDPVGTCADFLVDSRDGRMVCILLDLNARHHNAQAIFVPERFEFADDALVISASESELTAQSKNQSASEPELDATGMPPVVVGPFGYTFAPLLATAIVNAVLGRQRESSRPKPDLDKYDANWHWFTKLQGLPVFDVTRRIGGLVDIVAGGAPLRCRELRVGENPENARALPFSKLRNIDKDATSVIVELSATPPYSTEAIVEAMKGDGSATT